MTSCTSSGSFGRTCSGSSSTTYGYYGGLYYGTYDPANYVAPSAAVAAPVVTVVIMLIISVLVFVGLEMRYRKMKGAEPQAPKQPTP